MLEQIHKMQLTEQIPQSGWVRMSTSPQQNKLNSESLNYAAHKVQSDSFWQFFSHSIQLLVLSKLPLKGQVTVVLLIVLQPVVVCEVKASHVSFGWRLSECGSK